MMKLGLGLGITTATARSSSGEPVETPIRIVPVSSTKAFVIAPHEWGAIAYELIYQNGGSTTTPSTSVGAPFGGWRWYGTHHLLTVESNPNTPIATPHQDIGSVDSAAQGNFGFARFAGHYHGGIVINSSKMPDLTTERYVASFNFGYEATLTWEGGETATVSFDQSIEPDGSLAGSISYTSTQAFYNVLLSMVIGNNFTHFSDDGGATWQDGTATANYPVAAAPVILRQASTGYEIEIGTDQLAPSELAEGKVAMIGSATPATFDPATGQGSATKTTLANQSFVVWDELEPSAQYFMEVENTGTNELTVRTGPAATYQGTGPGWVAGTAAFTVPAGTVRSGTVTSDAGGDASLTITSNSNSSTFIVRKMARLLVPSAGLTNEVTNNGQSRLKHYVRRSSQGQPLGTLAMSRTITFRKTAPDPVPEFEPITLSFTGLSGELPPDWIKTNQNTATGTQTSVLDGTVWKLAAGATPVGNLRLAYPLPSLVKDGATVYQVEIDYTSLTNQTTMHAMINKDGIGSNSSANNLAITGGSDSYREILGGFGTGALTASFTFVIPAGTAAPHLLLDGPGASNRGVSISQIRITQV